MLRISQYQYFAAILLVMVLSFLLYPTKRGIDPKSTLVNFLHLFSFSTHFGSQMWVTLVAGLTMFYNLPRIMFGQVQSRLFPMFFLSSLVMSSITLTTYVIQHPYETWGRIQFIEVCALTTCLISTSINTFVLSPLVVDIMIKRFELENEFGNGVAYTVGSTADLTEMKKNPIYLHIHRLFRRLHISSALANVITLFANLIHLYYLSCQCQPV
ncbi:hypothetical protein ScPMuIL_008378 [Solemya velum]